MKVLGRPVDRVDGRLKVTGGAKYAADHSFAVAVHIVRGRIDEVAAIQERLDQRFTMFRFVSGSIAAEPESTRRKHRGAQARIPMSRPR